MLAFSWNVMLDSHPSPFKQSHGRPGLSRLRRYARREEARLASANAATKETSNKKDTAEVAVQVDKTARVTCDAAVQADHSSTAVLATHHHPAVEAVPKQPAAQAVVARQLPVAQAAFTAEQARPWLPHHHPVQDALCPDLHYGVAGFAPRHVSPDIPQIDGNTEQTWSCKCCTYERFFNTEHQLKQHHDAEHDEWEECNWCYPYHVWIDQT